MSGHGDPARMPDWFPEREGEPREDDAAGWAPSPGNNGLTPAQYRRYCTLRSEGVGVSEAWSQARSEAP